MQGFLIARKGGRGGGGRNRSQHTQHSNPLEDQSGASSFLRDPCLTCPPLELLSTSGPLPRPLRPSRVPPPCPSLAQLLPQGAPHPDFRPFVDKGPSRKIGWTLPSPHTWGLRFVGQIPVWAPERTEPASAGPPPAIPGLQARLSPGRTEPASWRSSQGSALTLGLGLGGWGMVWRSGGGGLFELAGDLSLGRHIYKLSFTFVETQFPYQARRVFCSGMENVKE